MSAVSQVSPQQYFGSVAAAPQSQLNLSTFMQLMTTQLQNQDPTAPMSDADFFAQMAQLGQVQGVDQLVKQSQVQQAQSLMGKTVTSVVPYVAGQSSANSTVTGTVTGMKVKNGNYMLTIQPATGSAVDVDMNALQSVSPTVDLSNAASLIGKNVSGPATVNVNGTTSQIDAVGQVIGLTNNNGAVQLQVQTQKNGVVQIDASQVENISS